MPLRYFDVTSADGTRLRAWTNNAAGPPVLLCNGLGTNPYAWPSLLREDCGLHVVSWNHRGVGGSDRPADNRINLDSYIEDALAVMDHIGWQRVPVASWSAGVTVAFELAGRHPSRVSGIFAVAGVPGNTFGTMLEPLHVPPPVAKFAMAGLAGLAAVSGNVLAPAVNRIPWTPGMANLVRCSHFIKPAADTDDVQRLLEEFFSTHPRWYGKLSLAIGKQARVSLSSITVPTSFLAGKYDILSGARAMRTAAKRIPGSRYRLIEATHFMSLEYPEIVRSELQALVNRARQSCESASG